MNIFENMSIKARLSLFIGILVISNLALLLVTDSRLGVTNDNFSEYEHAGVPGKMISLMIKEDMNYVSRLTRSIMLGDDYQKNMDRLNERLEKIYANFDELRQVVDEIRDPTRAERVKKAINSSITDTRAFLEDGRTLMAGLAARERSQELLQQTWNTYRKQASPLANQARGSFGTLIELIDEQMELSRSASAESLDSVLTITTVTNIVVVAILLLFGVLISRSITNPLSHLQHAIFAIDTHADLTGRINLHGRDEISQVAQATDRMLQRLHDSIAQVAGGPIA